MKKHVLCNAVLAISLGVASNAYGSSTNLLKNGSFESGASNFQFTNNHRNIELKTNMAGKWLSREKHQDKQMDLASATALSNQDGKTSMMFQSTARRGLVQLVDVSKQDTKGMQLDFSALFAAPGREAKKDKDIAAYEVIAFNDISQVRTDIGGTYKFSGKNYDAVIPMVKLADSELNDNSYTRFSGKATISKNYKYFAVLVGGLAGVKNKDHQYVAVDDVRLSMTKISNDSTTENTETKPDQQPNTPAEKVASGTEIRLIADTNNSSKSGYGGALKNTTNDNFNYDPVSPTKVLPTQRWHSSAGFHAGLKEKSTAQLSYQLANGSMSLASGQQFHVDLYGRDELSDRTANIDIQLYRGGVGGELVQTVKGLAITKQAKNHVRASFTTNGSFDTVVVLGHDTTSSNGNLFTLMEIRAAVTGGSVSPPEEKDSKPDDQPSPPSEKVASGTEIRLLADTNNSSKSGYGGALKNTTNDKFNYDPVSPTKVLPTQRWDSSAGFHAGLKEKSTAQLSYKLAHGAISLASGQQFHVDLYGRDELSDRTANIDIQLYRGGVAGELVKTVKGLAITKQAKNHVRASFTTKGSFDTVVVLGHDTTSSKGNLFTLMEIRAAVTGGSVVPPVENPDRDGDGVPNEHDAFPDDAKEFIDTDKDGIGNNADTDDDNDGVNDSDDVFPLDASETIDTDNDGIGNNADSDDDNDGVIDVEDAFPLDVAKSKEDAPNGISICGAASASDWSLDKTNSQLNFTSIKKSHITEVHSFGEVSGKFSIDGNASLTVDLASVDTGIPVRNDRMGLHLFNVAMSPVATASIQLPSEMLESIAQGGGYSADLTYKLDLHGFDKEIKVATKVSCVSQDQVLIRSKVPFIIDAKTFGLDTGIEVLRNLANLDSISPFSTVDFTLVYSRDEN